jgi:hypothetical protein
MASTKARTSIWSSQTLTAGAGNTTSSYVDINTGYGAQVNVVLTNGATGPTVAAQVQIQVTNDTGHTIVTNFGGALQGGVANSGVYYFSVDLPIGVCSVRLVAGSNTAQNVTVDADISNVTAI